MAVDGVLWLPFILTIDKRMCREESTKIATNALNIILAATEAKKEAGEKVLAEEKKTAKQVTKKSATQKTTANKSTVKKNTTNKK